MRKPFKITKEDRQTPVFNRVSKFIPEQALSLRDMLEQFSFMSGERVSEIVNRGYIGDEDDDDVIGVDASALDFTEIHDRLIDRMNKSSLVREPRVKAEPEPSPREVGEHVDENPPASADEDAPA